MDKLGARERENASRVHQEMVVGRCHVGEAGFGDHVGAGELDGHVRPAAEHVGDDSLVPRIQMLDDQQRHPQPGRQRPQDAAQRGDTAGGRCYGDDLEFPGRAFLALAEYP